MSNMRLPARIVIDTERGEVRDMAGLKIGLVQNIDYRRESEIDHELGVVMKLRDELIVELRLPLFAQPPAPEPSVANPLHEATEIAKRNLPILLRDRGSQHEPSVDVEALCAHVSDHLLRNIDGGHYPENLDLALSAIRAFFGAEQPATQRDGFLSPTGGSA